MINFKSNLKLFINNEEYDFDHNVSFEFHPTNFSSITLNNVIKKTNNVFPLNTSIINYSREFTIVELRQDDKPVFVGIVNDIGRLNIMPNSLKTFSIKIADFRKWLSLTKPINKIYLNKTPFQIINDLISSLNEPKIAVGDIKFSTSNDFVIKAYNTTNKTLYQVLKDVMERQTNSLLYFTTQDGKVLINYKSNDSFKQTSNIVLNINDQEFLEKYKIMNIEFDNETTDYYNYLSYTSDNTISKLFKTEKDLPMNNQKIVLANSPIKIVDDIKYTFIKNTSNGGIRVPFILNQKNYQDGQYYDILYSESSNTLEVRTPNNDEQLTISYYIKQKLTLEAKNNQEISEIAQLSNTNGIVFKTEKFNDISNPDDLLAAVKNDLNKYSTPSKILTLNCREMIWDILDSIQVVNISPDIDGIYIVESYKGNFIPLGDKVFQNITYTIKQSKNMNNVLNKFDNQSYRDNPVYESDLFIDETQTINETANIIYSLNDFNIINNIVIDDNFLQQDLQIKLVNENINIKYKLLKVE